MNSPKYKVGDELYYINPFVFIIEKVRIEFVEEDTETGLYFYVDWTGAYLSEFDLTRTLPDAKQLALDYLNRFYRQREHEILHANPQLDFEEND
jgi:hypothetical protein